MASRFTNISLVSFILCFLLSPHYFVGSQVDSSDCGLAFLGQLPFKAYVTRTTPPLKTLYQFFVVNTSTLLSNGIAYSISEGERFGGADFIIDATTGQLFNRNYFPQSGPARYDLAVKATPLSEDQTCTVGANLTINIIPEVNTASRYEHGQYAVEVTEGLLAGSLVLPVRAFSPHPHNSGALYGLVGGNLLGDFTIDPQSGLLRVERELDRERADGYELIVRYVDAFSSLDTTVSISVLDRNDNSPQFSQALYSVTTPENIPVDTVIFNLLATDPDLGENGRVYLTLDSSVSSTFALDSQTGNLSTIAEIDYEIQAKYQFTVTASDGANPPASSQTVVFINVVNIDDECPIFSSPAFTQELSYDPDRQLAPTVGMAVFTVTASDPDKLSNVTYSIASGNDAGVLALNSSTGVVSIAKLPGDPSGQYSMEVYASDAGCVNQSSVRVQVGIGGTNEHRPSFTGPCTASIPENPALGTVVVTLSATDDDSGTNGAVGYAFTTPHQLFSIDPLSGEVMTTKSPENYDHEIQHTFQIDVTATDGGNRQDHCLLTIALEDINDNYPTFQLSEYQTSLAMAASPGTVLLQLLAEDIDLGDNGTVVYFINYTDTSQEQLLEITPQGGIITTTNLSISSPSSLDIEVIAEDQGSPPLSSSVTVHVSITNGNQHPVFQQHKYFTTVCENLAALSSVLTVAAVSGVAGNVFYSTLGGVNYQSNEDEIFRVNVDGTIAVTSQGSVDYERLPTGSKRFLFYVSAQNLYGSSLALVEVAVTDQDDNPPEFPFLSLSLAIAEGEPVGTVLTHLRASDPDDGTNGEVVYSIEGSADYFGVTADGTISSLIEFDFEDASHAAGFSFLVDAFNPNPTNGRNCSIGSPGRARALVTVMVIDQNDNPPLFNSSHIDLSLPESHPVMSTAYTLEVSDLDSSSRGQLSYRITAGNRGMAFAVDNDGHLTLVQRLDYEAITAYSLEVVVTDGLHTDSVSIDVTVMDIDDEPPTFGSDSYFAQLTENAPLETLVLTVEASDPDTARVTYSLHGLDASCFSIDRRGEIVVSCSVDREEFPSGVARFLVFAEGGSIAAADVEVEIVDVNDYHPRFLQPLYGEVVENSQPGTEGVLTMRVRAVDLDEGLNGFLTYALLSGEENGFEIDPSTGDITAYRTYDRETNPSFVMTVMAVDSGTPTQLNSTAEVIIYIQDVNDNGPHFLYPYMFARIFENSPMYTPVLFVPALDPDNGISASITFILDSVSTMELAYSLNSTTGEISIVGSLDYDIMPGQLYSATLSLKSKDFLSDTQALVEIELLDRNDHAPQVTELDLPLGNLISENVPAGTVVARIAASNREEESNGGIVFGITAGDPHKDFRLVVEDLVGFITTVAIDRERVPLYTLEVTITDSGYPAQSTVVMLNFTITDVNDVSPTFTREHYIGSVAENAPPVTSILKVSATDPDVGGDGTITSYEIVSGDQEQRFTLDPVTGVLGSAVVFDREETSEYELMIRATDGGLVPLVGMAMVTIIVTDVDDNIPKDGGEMRVFIAAPAGQSLTGEIAPVFFSDPDSSSKFQDCVVLGGQDLDEFSVNDDCTITAASASREGQFRLEISGNDGIHGPVSSYVNITLQPVPTALLTPDVLVTVTLHLTPSNYLNQMSSAFPSLLANVFDTSMQYIFIVCVQPGYHSETTTTDVTFAAQRDGSVLESAAILQALYLQRSSFSAAGFPLFALPTDPCVTEPCQNEAACVTTTLIADAQTLASSSRGNAVIYGPRISIGYHCQCVPGTAGENCEVNSNDCYSNPCLHGAECRDELNGYTCDCPEGTGGQDCSLSVDQCSTNHCKNGATCHNVLGSYECDCPIGYYGPECQYQHFQKSSLCDPNPCLNSAECSPGRDSFTCVCQEGFSGDLCEDRVLIQGGCTGNPCHNGSTCLDTSEGYVCICSVGFTGPNCRWPLNNCELEPCRNGGTCLAGFYGSYQCTCPPGRTGVNCSNFIPACDVVPCLNGGRCRNMEGGLYVCECTREFWGTDCELSIRAKNHCDSEPCRNSGNCTAGRETYTCSCPTNYTGSDCLVEFASSDPCSTNPCQHGSVCVSQLEEGSFANYSYTCECARGFEGEKCELNINDCDPNPCLNGGVCQDEIDGYICDCPDQITGRTCAVYCPDGRRGEFCELSLQYCSPNPCNNNGTCTENKNAAGYTCSCSPGFTGVTCDAELQCDSSLCRNGGTCTSVSSEGTRCNCKTGFDGEHCELLVASFSGSQTKNSYRAFEPLEIRGQSSLSFQFATLDFDAVLLYSAQYQFGTTRNYLAVAIVRGNLQVMMSHGESNDASLQVMSSAVVVNDGLWHDVSITSSGNVSTPYYIIMQHLTIYCTVALGVSSTL